MTDLRAIYEAMHRECAAIARLEIARAVAKTAVCEGLLSGSIDEVAEKLHEAMLRCKPNELPDNVIQGPW